MGDRRRFARISVLNALSGETPSIDGRLVVRDISHKGFAVETRMPFALDSRHRFHLRGTRGLSVLVEATAKHTMRVASESGESRYLTGFAFSPMTPDHRARLTVLLEELAAPV